MRVSFSDSQPKHLLKNSWWKSSPPRIEGLPASPNVPNTKTNGMRHSPAVSGSENKEYGAGSNGWASFTPSFELL